jgi:hypothetical protein
MVSQIIHLILCISFHGRGLLSLHKIFASLTTLVSGPYILSQLLLVILCYLPSTNPGPGVYLVVVILKRLKLGGGHVYDGSSVLDCHGSVNYY